MAKKVIAIEGDGTAGVEQGILAGEATPESSELSLDFTAETGALYTSEPKLANLVVIEANTGGQTLTVAVITDGTVNTLNTTVSTASKQRVEIPIALTGTIWSVRLTATALTTRIEVAAIELNFPDTGVDNPE